MSNSRGSTKPSHREALHRLEKKVSGWPLPSSPEGILSDDLFECKPEELPGVSKGGEGRPYFTRPIWGDHGQRKRSSVFGRWKARDGKKEIKDLDDRPLGSVQHLIYFKRGDPEERTKWAMKEYMLASSRIPPGVDELSLCIIYWTKDYRRKETPSDDAGPSSHPPSEPGLQAEDQVVPHFPDPSLSMEFPMDFSMDLDGVAWMDDCYGQE